MNDHSYVIDLTDLQFVKAAETLEQAEYWAAILVPRNEHVIVSMTEEHLRPMPTIDLYRLVSETPQGNGGELPPKHSLITKALAIMSNLPIDTTPVSELREKLGRDLPAPDPQPREMPGEEKKVKDKPITSPNRPRPGSKTARVWELADELGNRAAVIAACEKEGVNPSTAATQYARWKHSTG